MKWPNVRGFMKPSDESILKPFQTDLSFINNDPMRNQLVQVGEPEDDGGWNTGETRWYRWGT